MFNFLKKTSPKFVSYEKISRDTCEIITDRGTFRNDYLYWFNMDTTEQVTPFSSLESWLGDEKRKQEFKSKHGVKE